MPADPQLAAYYAQRAPDYDRIYTKPERQADLGQLRTLVTEWARGRRILEIACGTGWWTEVLAETASTVTALDINPEVLTLAEQRLRARQHETQRPPLQASVEFLCQDLFSAALGPRTFDAGFAGFWWSHVPRQEVATFLSTFHRRLPVGAPVLFLDNRYVEGSSTPIARADAEGNTYQARARADGSSQEVLKNFPTASELHSVLSPHGTRLHVTELTYYWAASYETAAAPDASHSLDL